MKCDFSGYATKNELLCSDGRIIKRDAFKDNDGCKVPLVWQHQHKEPGNILGHAILENRNDGVYAYCSFNKSENAKDAKELIAHGDINSMSIFANELIHKGRNVIHGNIKEVSLVLSGANPGASIDSVSFKHNDEDESDDEAIIYTGLYLKHSDSDDEDLEETDENDKKNEEDKTLQEIFDSLTDEQKELVYILISQIEDSNEEKNETNDEGDDEMKKNVFDKTEEKEKNLTHSDIKEVFDDAIKLGSLKASVLQHGITNIDVLFPEAKNISNEPDLITRNMEWVNDVINSVRKSPFSRIKSSAFNLTEDEARAKGYIKTKEKKEETISALKRITTPQTIYKKQKLDRDDMLDITDMDVVSFLKSEMRIMINEEIARAILIGDGRNVGSEERINPDNIRPIYKDVDTYTVKSIIEFQAADDKNKRATALTEDVLAQRANYKGSGNPTLYVSPGTLTDMLLIKNKNDDRIYKTEAELASAMRVSKIVEVPLMDGLKRVDAGKDVKLLAIMVNLMDYTIGADKGGDLTMFDDFDIDFNQYKYLLETRISGALKVPYSAITFESKDK